MINVSPTAASKINELLAEEGKTGSGLRVFVQGGGCSGFQYGFALDDKDEPGDLLVERDGAKVAVDDMSLMYLLGSELDWVEDLTGSYFRMKNPNASSQCGCGTSFAI